MIPVLAPLRHLHTAEGLCELVGRTPLVRVTTPLPSSHPGFYAKAECLAAPGMKARPAMAMLEGARARGDLAPGAAVVESTSGTLGLGLAFAGIVYGHPIVLVVDAELDPMMRSLLTAHGARLEFVRIPHPTGGWQEARRARLQELLAELPGSYWPNQYDNPDNVDGYAGLAEEMVEQLDHVDHVDHLVCSVGTGGHSAGLLHRLRDCWPSIRLVGVDATGSTIFGQQAQPRLMRGLGSSIHPDNVDYDAFAEVHWVGPVEAVDACRRLARGAFVTGGWSTGAVALVAAWVARTDPGSTVAAVFPDGPHRYYNTVYDDAWCRARGLLDRVVPAAPLEIGHPHDAQALRWSRCAQVADPLGRP